jgi:cation diffusion facilitator CzcD-associated flavoprotein CzcO
MEQRYNVVIIGAGLAGLGMAMRLKAEGESDFVILEKADRVGGTWRDNTYPGAACDVQSHLYWYSFDAQPDWSHVYCAQPEILANIERLSERSGLVPHIRFNAEVTGVQWDDAAARWRIQTAAGETMTARTLVTAWGQLNRPSFRDLEGRDSFKGVSFHSSRWRDDVDLAGKRVATIGNAASAVQLIPQIAPKVAQLKVFQRSANYVVPRMDRPYEAEERRLYLEEPERLLASREAFYQEHEIWHHAMRQDTDGAREFTALARAHLEGQVADPALREKLWPDYPIGCKRIIISDDFYPALTRPNVSLVTDRISRIEPDGVRMADGVLHEVDVIVFATGFETLSFLGTLEITGRGGASLREAWRDGPEAYLGMNIAGFPNLFMLYGPNTNLGHNSILTMLECQFDYVLQALRACAACAADAIDVRPEVMMKFNQKLQNDMQGTAWAGNCTSWYKTASGRITNNWSGNVEDYRRRTARFEPDDYEMIRAGVLETVA